MLDEDLPTLYDLGVALGSRWWRVFGLARPAPQLFRAVLNHDVELNSAIELDGDVVGCAALFEHSPTNDTIWLDVALLDAVPDREAVLLDVGAQMTGQAFRNWSVRKLYASHLGGDPSPLAGSGAPVHEEGRIRRSVLHDGDHLDRVITAVYRDEVPAPTAGADA